MKVLREIMERYYADLGYRTSPKYFQLARSLLPVGGLSGALGQRMPPSRLAIVSGKAVLFAWPMGKLKQLAALLPDVLGEFSYRSCKATWILSPGRRKELSGSDCDRHQSPLQARPSDGFDAQGFLSGRRNRSGAGSKRPMVIHLKPLRRYGKT